MAPDSQSLGKSIGVIGIPELVHQVWKATLPSTSQKRCPFLKKIHCHVTENKTTVEIYDDHDMKVSPRTVQSPLYIIMSSSHCVKRQSKNPRDWMSDYVCLSHSFKLSAKWKYSVVSLSNPMGFKLFIFDILICVYLFIIGMCHLLI